MFILVFSMDIIVLFYGLNFWYYFIKRLIKKVECLNNKDYMVWLDELKILNMKWILWILFFILSKGGDNLIYVILMSIYEYE